MVKRPTSKKVAKEDTQPDRIIRAIAHDFKEPLRTIRWFNTRILRVEPPDSQMAKRLQRYDRKIQDAQKSFQKFYDQYKKSPKVRRFREHVQNDLGGILSSASLEWAPISDWVLGLEHEFGTVHAKNLNEVTKRLFRRFDGLVRYLEAAGIPQLKQLGIHNEISRVSSDITGLRSRERIFATIIRQDGYLVDLFDQTLIALMIQNLLSNSIKYRRTRVSPDFYFRMGEFDTSKLQDEEILQRVPEELLQKPFLSAIIYQDSARGFSSDFEDRVFRPFFQVPRSDGSVDGSGSGMGLAIVQTAVDRHAGAIWAYSERNVGTKFCAVFPRKYQSGRATLMLDPNEVLSRKRME